jgi:predicted NBD/HSP70 family sugar kinase/mannose-6-phosphate isomerase class I
LGSNMFKHSYKYVLGVDVGGSHISSALIASDGVMLEKSFKRKEIDGHADSNTILKQWTDTLNDTIASATEFELAGVGIAIPGPFDYDKGISLIKGVDKYQALYGMNIKDTLRSKLGLCDVPVFFENDACCFALGEAKHGEASSRQRVIAITLGTGFGAAFVENGCLVKQAKNLPKDGCLYNVPLFNGIAEDYISSRWLLTSFLKLSGRQVPDVKTIARLAYCGDEVALVVFRLFGENIGKCLAPWIQSFNADCLVIGGSIAQSTDLFMPEIIKVLKDQVGPDFAIKTSTKTELSTLMGAAELISAREIENDELRTITTTWRKSSQELMPHRTSEVTELRGVYNRYPFHSLGAGHIFSGYNSLAEWIAQNKILIIDGCVGNDWASIRKTLCGIFRKNGIEVLWYEMGAFLKPEEEIENLVAPFLGTGNSVWGKRTTLKLEDFYCLGDIENLQPERNENMLVILIGTGSALANWDAPVVYIDLPKNELQFRMRAGSICNIGRSRPDAPSAMYKRFYFVDWVLLNEHRKNIKDRITVVADGQWKDQINWALHSSIADGLLQLSRSVLRVRPWFEPGAWGGQWMKEHIPFINKEEINYAWSFELIVPENGIVFESDGFLMEVAFGWLMEQNAKNILGMHEERFGLEFPIRFDFLDTYDGGNLSVQCHPSLNYIREQFGERITQDETYYILDCKDDAGVFLGFNQDICPATFREELNHSFEYNTPISIEKYVQKHRSRKHGLFLIPSETVHSAGEGNLVLEISATPYIFTFKMYDWVRPDLNGLPRPINIDHAFNNLNFERKGSRVVDELISKPRVLKQGSDWQIVHLPTHQEHFYDVHRLEFDKLLAINTNGTCHVLMLVEGESILVETANGSKNEFAYAETVIVPQAATSYVLTNLGSGRARVIQAFLK